MAKSTSESTQPVQYYTRFDKYQRLEHFIFLLSFTILAITGLVQKYAKSPVSQTIIETLDGIETTRLIHHAAAVVLMIVSIYHLLIVLYRLIVLRVPWTMAPVIDDFKHLYEDVMYYFGLRKHKAYYGRYNYAEKVEYLAVVWGTIIMAITGFMMWNPIATTKFLSGEFIPAAKAAHGGEAVLAVSAIIIWHFYHVHVRHFNKSMFTGKLSEEQMAHEHPAELAQIKSGNAYERPTKDILQRRHKKFWPVASVIALVSGLGLISFVTLETTAIETIPPAETAQVYVPVTPTPQPTRAATPTAAPAEGVAANSWDGNFSALFDNRCGTCHGITKVGGLTLATYQGALAGGNSGPGIVPGNPDASMIVQIQAQGGHPGQLTPEELQQVIDWIQAGAPEN
jgi:cytochrome b subunit of formate dehydrogenase/mono/diheme cytochrome c family protein